jgi:hypothetical protein
MGNGAYIKKAGRIVYQFQPWRENLLDFFDLDYPFYPYRCGDQTSIFCLQSRWGFQSFFSLYLSVCHDNKSYVLSN